MKTEREVLARSDRVLLGRFTIEDHAAVHTFASDPQVCRYMSWGPNSESDTNEFLAQSIPVTPGRLNLAVIVDQAVIGSASVWTTDNEHKNGELGYVLRVDHWGRGFATETARLLLHLGAEHLDLERIAATCDVENIASARVLEKAGMHREGIHRGHRLVRGERRDHLAFAWLVSPEGITVVEPTTSTSQTPRIG